MESEQPESTPVVYESSDGSRTLYIESMDETYHSRHGAIPESLHVFTGNGLHHYLQTAETSSLDILEIGFGTGLNAMLTYLESEHKPIQILYDSLETYPLPYTLVQQLGYNSHWDSNKEIYFKAMHEATWNEACRITPEFTLRKLNTSIHQFYPDKQYDVIYFDAFGPEKQPDMWTYNVFSKLYSCLKTGGILVTYSSKGDVKRTLLSCGFTVEKIQGPPRKRHMLRASKPTQ